MSPAVSDYPCSPDATLAIDRHRPRVALVAPSLEILGGQGIQAEALARHLRLNGHRIDRIAVNPRFRGPLRLLRRVPYARTLLNELLYVPGLIRLRHADVVHIFSASYWSFLLAPAPALVAARLLGKPTVLHYHSGEADDHLTHWGALVHPWLRLADEIVVPSVYLRDVFARHGYRARVIRNVIDTTAFHYRERGPLQPRILSVRNLERHYRVDVTLRAFARLQARYPAATLTVAGYGREAGALQALARSLDLRHVRFTGRVEPADLPALYDEADVFVNASEIDNQPVSILEAFASGLPVVSTPTGDIGAMLHDGRAGAIVPPNQPVAMAEAIAELLTDEARARAIVRQARWESRRYTWPRVAPDWSRLYDDLTTREAARSTAAVAEPPGARRQVDRA